MPADFDSDEQVVRALLAHRSVVLERWRDQLEPLVDTSVAGGGWESGIAGTVFEFAIGFDLSTTVPYQDALAKLQPASCRELLSSLGFDPARGDGLLDGEVDFAAWARSPERAVALGRVLSGACAVEQIYRVMSKLDIEQGWFEERLGPPNEYSGTSEISELVAQLWELYLASGRDHLRSCGVLIEARPRFHARAVGDLVIGRTLVDVKAKTNPFIDLEKDLIQLLRYILFDQDDTYRFDAVMLYLGYQGMALEQPLPWALESLVGEPEVSLENLRGDFARLRLVG